MVALITGAAGGIGSAVARALAAGGACVVATDLDAQGAAALADELGEVAISARADVLDEQGIDRRVPHRGDSRSAASTSSSRTPASPRARRSRRPRSSCGIATTTSSRAGTFSSPGRPRARCGRRRAAAASSSSDRRTASPPARTRRRTRPRRQPSLHLARCLAEELGPSGIRVNTVNPDAVLEGSRIWDSDWREERARAYGIPADELEEHYRARTTLKVNVTARGRRGGRAVLASPRRARQEHGQPPQRRRRRRARVPA